MLNLEGWKRIHDACPDLKPEGLDIRVDEDGDVVYLVDMPDIQVVQESDPADTWKQEEELQVIPGAGVASVVPESVAEAMVGYKAVWWLAAQQKRGLTLWDTDDGTPNIQRYCIEGNRVASAYDRQHSWNADPTEALRLACCKILGVTP